MEFISQEMEVGKKIQIVKLNKEEEYLASQILDIIDDKRIVISGPIKQNNLVFVHSGELIKLYYTVKDKGIYSYTAKVLSREQSPVYTLEIERVSKIIKTQKREHYRLLSGLTVIKEHEILEKGQIETYQEECVTKDISGGGVRINCNFKHEINDKIRCNIKIEDSIVGINASIRRIEEIDTPNYKYSIGVSFSEMDEYNIDRIISYIFEQQRILRNKGLI